MVKRLPTMQATQIQSLGWEDPLEKAMATHSSTIAWKIPCIEEPGRLQSMGLQWVGHDWATSLIEWAKDMLHLAAVRNCCLMSYYSHSKSKEYLKGSWIPLWCIMIGYKPINYRNWRCLQKKSCCSFCYNEEDVPSFWEAHRLTYSIEQHKQNFHTRINRVKHCSCSMWFKKLEVRTWPFSS